MLQKRYYTFRVCDSDTGALAKHLAEKLNSLTAFGWNIERIDCVENKFGAWNSEGLKYDTTHEYIILASTGNNIEGD